MDRRSWEFAYPPIIDGKRTTIRGSCRRTGCGAVFSVWTPSRLRRGV